MKAGEPETPKSPRYNLHEWTRTAHSTPYVLLDRTAHDRPGANAADLKNNAAAARLAPFIANRDFKRALKYLKELGPDDAEPYWIAYHIGKVLGYQEKWRKAMRHLQQALMLAPNRAVVHHGLGIALHALGRHAEAIEAHERAIEIQHDYVEAWQSLGLALLTAGDGQAAAAAFRLGYSHLARLAIKAAGGTVRPLAATPSGFAADDPFLESLSIDEHAAAHLVEDGRFAQIMFHYGMALVSIDQHEDAKQAFEEALRFGLDGGERENAARWLAKHAAGAVTRRLN